MRSGVTYNPNTPASILDKLAADDCENVRGGVAGNLNTPVPILEKLAADDEEDVRAGVAGNPNTPALLLETLALFVKTFAEQFKKITLCHNIKDI